MSRAVARRGDDTPHWNIVLLQQVLGNSRRSFLAELLVELFRAGGRGEARDLNHVTFLAQGETGKLVQICLGGVIQDSLARVEIDSSYGFGLIVAEVRDTVV